MRALLAVAVLALTLVAAQCQPPPAPPVVTTDAGPDVPIDHDAGVLAYSDTPVGHACANIGRVGCAAGRSSLCEKVLRHAVNMQISAIDLDCLTAAQSKASVQACGFVRCN